MNRISNTVIHNVVTLYVFIYSQKNIQEPELKGEDKAVQYFLLQNADEFQ